MSWRRWLALCGLATKVCLCSLSTSGAALGNGSLGKAYPNYVFNMFIKSLLLHLPKYNEGMLKFGLK